MSNSFTNSFELRDEERKTAPERDDAADNAKEIWEQFINLLSQSIKQSEIKTWFSVINPKSFDGNVMTIEVPSKDFYGMIEKRYNKKISAIIESGLLGEHGSLNYVVAQESLFEENQTANRTEPSEHANVTNFKYPYGTGSYETKKEEEPFSSNLLIRHTFENFVKGESNDLAVATAYAIANNPGGAYNPYLVYGGVGVGKTHLVQAIGNEILKKNPGKRVYCLTTQEFTNQFTTSIATQKLDFSHGRGGTKNLDNFYRSLDVLILDDIQNLEGKPGTQDFMYQIFNYLYNNKKQIIFSSDKPISQLKSITERLISRFQWGITVDIQAPSWEMRVAIIQKKLDEANINDVPDDVIHFIASNIKDSIRSIEGCIVNLIAESLFVTKGEINLELAERVVHKFLGNVRRAKSVSIENIIFATSEYFKISENQILSRKRTKEIAFARQVAMYLAKDMTSYTLESIGLNFGGKDHATVLYAFNMINESRKKNSEVQNIISDIKNSLSRM
ncbi:MAG: chromosomal replication initiator protein DnaA [Ignavibacteria bacterium]|nr:chromosomal replication initiator protein DnaA [Ignavibacteria bacterium]